MARNSSEYRFVKYGSSIYDANTSKNYPLKHVVYSLTPYVQSTQAILSPTTKNQRLYIRYLKLDYTSVNSDIQHVDVNLFGIYDNQPTQLLDCFVDYSGQPDIPDNQNSYNYEKMTVPHIILDAATPLYFYYYSNRNFDTYWDRVFLSISYAEVDNE